MTIRIHFFQNVLFYVVSDDITRAREKLEKLNKNQTYNIVYPTACRYCPFQWSQPPGKSRQYPIYPLFANNFRNYSRQ